MNKNLKQQAIRARSSARRQLLQLLYQWQISGDEPRLVYLNRIPDPYASDIDRHYFDDAYDTICNERDTLEAYSSGALNRAANSLDPIERAILWIGTYELQHRPDIHPTVIINEAVELAKQFGAEDSYKFINATLDKLAKNRPSTPPAVQPNHDEQDEQQDDSAQPPATSP